MNRNVIGAVFSLALISLVTQAQTSNVTNANNGSNGNIPAYTGSTTLGSSPINISGNNVGIGTGAPADPLHIKGGVPGSVTNELRIGTIGGIAGTGVRLRFVAGEDSSPTEIGNIRGVLTVGLSGGSYMGLGGQGQVDTLALTSSGLVGIGTTSPAYTLDVAGAIRTQTGVYFPGSSAPQTTPWTGVLCGGDYAESVDVTGTREHYGPGDVMVVDPGTPGNFRRASDPYSTLVAGIYSTKPGAVGRRSVEQSKAKDEIPMAMIGIVPTKVSAENGPVKIGDLLVTSSTPGYAMRGTDRSRMTGAIVGKALGTVEKDTGIIEVLVTLQ